MRDISNGTDLGIEYNWDNDPCRKIVDQRYKVKVRDERGAGGMNFVLRRRAERLASLGFEVDANVQLTAQKFYTSPLECLEFVSEVEAAGFVFSIEERGFLNACGEYWGEISKADLEKILKGEKAPAYRLKSPSNPHFAPCCDIGD